MSGTNRPAPTELVTSGVTMTATSATVYGSTSYDMADVSSLVLHVTIGADPSGTSPTLDVKVQDSSTGIAGSFVDIASGAITQFSGATQSTSIGTRRLAVPQFGRYVRVVGTVGGSVSPTYTLVTVAFSCK